MGRTGLKVSEIGLGCNPLGGHVGEKEALIILDAALDRGITLFDTADIYFKGRCEEVVGKALKNWPRDKVVVISKVGGRMGYHANSGGLSRVHVMQAVDDSLRRLQTDYVDIYMAHFPSPETHIEETLRTFDDIVRGGKARYIGCSNFPAWRICKALWISSEQKIARFDCVQSRYNIVTRAVEQEVFPLCESEQIGVIAYNVLAGGLLTGKYSRNGPAPEGTRFGRLDLGQRYKTRYWYDRNFEALEKLRVIGQQYGHTLPQIALSWALNKPPVTCAIVGATSVEQLDHNLSALELSMSPAEMKACDDIWELTLPPGWSLQMGLDSLLPRS